MKNSYSRRLKRNLRKAFGESFLEEDLKELDEKLKSGKNSEQKENILKNFVTFLNFLDKSYLHLEGEVEISKNNIELSSFELSQARDSLLSMAESLAEGFFMVDKNLKGLPYYTSVCKEFLGGSPAFKHLFDILKISDEEQKNNLKLWTDAVFRNASDFKVLKPLCPIKVFSHPTKHIELEIAPAYEIYKKVDKLVVCLVDKTKEIEAREKLKQTEKEALKIIQISENKDGLHRLSVYVNNFLDQHHEQSLKVKKMNSKQIGEFKRLFHSLKGLSGQFGIESCLEHIKEVEKRLYGNFYTYSSLLEEVEKYQELLNEFLFQNINILGTEFHGFNQYIKINKQSLNEYLSKKDVQKREEFVKDILSRPISSFLTKFNKSIHELSLLVDKPMLPIKIKGGDTKFFLEAYHDFFSSFIHLFRNIMDHGIESSTERQHKGKKKLGLITVSVEEFVKDNQNWYRILVKDDGRGVDVAKIRRLEPEKTKGMRDFDAMQMIFQADFSTKDTCTELSGRGVGLDVIKEEVEKLKGAVWVESSQGQYCRFVFELPQTWDISYRQSEKYLQKAS